MKINFWFLAVVLSLATAYNKPVFAQSPTNTIAPSSNAQEIEKTNNINKLLEITGAKNISRQIITQLLISFKSEYPEVPQKFWDSFAAELKIDDMVNEFIPVYNKYFTNEEIKQIIAFYQTPVGKKTITVIPQISQESYDIGKKYGIAAAERALKKLEAEGYIRPKK
ncbi:MAG: DUF2059 domain-containing protein [Nostoc sp. DedVER02]|uniref:DUF2059 domain-containing protein n=1 Tax=unclassified Nostoc TaxID=2593658 RepID=UPI002AD2A50E|nr:MULTISPECIES: DUF2059 domain-containing protein [unclassified Nostoc]MDZ7990550.1 DUF2059 domain-containing protein [Nostoc sp. DedVER02]MDZ8113907.1 DUF2059 domain-containing protein [Nostoc sp. DedVER01b]